MYVKLIGHVGVDSGQLLLCDPCYIDSEWITEPFEDIRVYEHIRTKDRLQYKVDFSNYDEIIPDYGLSMNELNQTEEWRSVDEPVKSKNNFSYNACSQETLSKNGFGQLYYKMGNPGVGVAFSTGIGDGLFPVYAVYNDEDMLIGVEIKFLNDDLYD